MKYLCMFVLLAVLSCKKDNKSNEAIKDVTVENQINIDDIALDIYDFNGLEKFLNQEDDKVHVVNFWATWCKPCVKELPHFEAMNKKYQDKGVEVLLVNLDFPNQYEKKLKPFIVKYNLQSKILVLDDEDMNTWIPKVNKDWDGAIPATIIYSKDKRKFYSKPFTHDELENEIKQFLN